MNEFEKKVLRLAAEVCSRHGDIIGNRTCQDWYGREDLIEALSEAEKRCLLFNLEAYNSNGDDYDPEDVDRNFSDEMSVSWMMWQALLKMADETPILSPDETA